MMRSINVAAAVVGYSGVVSCRLLCPLIRPRIMIEDNKQFSDYYHPELDAEDEAIAIRFMRSRRKGKNSKQFSDDYHAELAAEYAAFTAKFERSQRERNRRLEGRKKSSEYYNSDLDAATAFAAGLYAELEVLQKLYHQNPLDVQILRKLAETMTDLAYVVIPSITYEQREEWVRVINY